MRLKTMPLLALLLVAGCATDPVQRVYQYRAAFAVAEAGLVKAHQQQWINDTEYRATKPAVMLARDTLNAVETDAIAGKPITATTWKSLASAVDRVVAAHAAARKGRS